MNRIGGYFYNYRKMVAAGLWSLLYVEVKGEFFIRDDLIWGCKAPSSSKSGEKEALVSHFTGSINYFQFSPFTVGGVASKGLGVSAHVSSYYCWRIVVEETYDVFGW